MNTTNDFFPEGDFPEIDTSNYMKFKKEGNHKFRALSSAIKGYEYFKADNKPVRSKTPFEDTPDMKPNGKVSLFWAFLVYNYQAKRIQILEIAQKTIREAMEGYINNPDWGSPKNYDITISRKGTTQNDTKYTVVPSPHKPLDQAILDEYAKMNIDLTALYEGIDPFQVDK
jgi:hypothetical protein